MLLEVCALDFNDTFQQQSADISGKWAATSWAKKLAAKKRRVNLSDFDRFKVMVAKKQKSKLIADKVKELA